jgi:hypothetical protein
MTRPKCDLCDRPATVHETAVGAGGPVVRHLCREHGTHVWAAALPSLTPKARDDFQKLIDEWGRKSLRRND